MAKATLPLESKVVKEVLAALKLLPGPSVFYKNHGGIYMKSGIADITGVWGGYFIAIECKRPGLFNPVEAGLSDAQRKFLLDVTMAGGYSFVTDNAEDLMKLLLAAVKPR